jgi:hypothetical protein
MESVVRPYFHEIYDLLLLIFTLPVQILSLVNMKIVLLYDVLAPVKIISIKNTCEQRAAA